MQACGDSFGGAGAGTPAGRRQGPCREAAGTVRDGGGRTLPGAAAVSRHAARAGLAGRRNERRGPCRWGGGVRGPGRGRGDAARRVGQEPSLLA
ncbi:hypothetical protein Sm713_19560 [Streptomyces sp. TS71-3]|nr:hypothetical protein Sm713_19560 [Streptomyces sp. TS71-3]